MNPEQWSKIQNAIIDAIETTHCKEHHEHISHRFGYDKAKRDIIAAVALAFAKLETEL